MAVESTAKEEFAQFPRRGLLAQLSLDLGALISSHGLSRAEVYCTHLHEAHRFLQIASLYGRQTLLPTIWEVHLLNKTCCDTAPSRWPACATERCCLAQVPTTLRSRSCRSIDRPDHKEMETALTAARMSRARLMNESGQVTGIGTIFASQVHADLHSFMCPDLMHSRQSALTLLLTRGMREQNAHRIGDGLSLTLLLPVELVAILARQPTPEVLHAVLFRAMRQTMLPAVSIACSLDAILEIPSAYMTSPELKSPHPHD